MTKESLKILLDSLYFQYKKKYSSVDPVWILHKFSKPKDIEIIGLITSCFAYGQVNLINNYIESILHRIGNKPYEFTINFTKHKDKKFLSGSGYRFHKEYDLINLFESIHISLIEYGSLNNLFLKNFDLNDENIIPALISFSTTMVNNIKPNDHPPTPFHAFCLAGRKGDKNFNYLLPNPENGSTCKRLNLFLRWMIRNDEIDFGIWKNIPPSKLIMPIDIHISRVAKRLKLVQRKSVDLKFAIELTEKLKEFDPIDPVKYDFSLCHYEMENSIKNEK